MNPDKQAAHEAWIQYRVEEIEAKSIPRRSTRKREFVAGYFAALNNAQGGRIVTVAFEDGESVTQCGLEDCECPEHEFKAPPAGTYLTIRLDDNLRILLGEHVRIVRGLIQDD